MGALVQTKLSRFASFKAIVSQPRPRLVPGSGFQFVNHVRFLKHAHGRHCLRPSAMKCWSCTRSFSVRAAFGKLG